MLRWQKIVSVAIGILPWISACRGPTPKSLSCRPSTETPSTESIEASQNLKEMDIFVDASGSMLGYLGERPANDHDHSTYYVQTLKSLSQIFEGSDAIRVDYHRIENEKREISRQEYRSAQLPIFYDGSQPRKFPQVSSPIEKAFSYRFLEDKVKVIITDLGQNTGDITKLQKIIKEKYLQYQNQNYAVGVWALKSQFSGNVYLPNTQDIIQDEVPSFYYQTTENDPETYRPVYVIVLGYRPHVEEVFNKIKRSVGELLNKSNSHVHIFSPYRVFRRIALPTEYPKLSSNLKPKQDSIHNGDAIVTAKDSSYELIEIPNRFPVNIDASSKAHTNRLDFNHELVLQPAAYTLNVLPEGIEPRIDVKVFDKFQEHFTIKPDDPKLKEGIINLKKAIQLSNWELDESENRLRFQMEFQTSEIEQSGIYKLEIDLVATDWQEPTWWKEWDWENRESNRDGSRIQNLLPFLRGLKELTVELKDSQNQPPIFGRLCYAIHQK